MAVAVFVGLARDKSPEPSPEIEIRGHLARATSAESKPKVSLKTDDGKEVALLRTKLSEALFVDSRLLEKHLVLKGRMATNGFDVKIIRSLVNGTVNDLYYWCDICAIEQVMPGECMCCREEVVLKETPVGMKPAGKNQKGKSAK